MNAEELKERTKQFALRVMHLVDALPKSTKARAIANQIIRSGTSVAANYRAACRARSRAEFISKVGVVEEEVGETALWLELIVADKILPNKKVQLSYPKRTNWSPSRPLPSFPPAPTEARSEEPHQNQQSAIKNQQYE